MQSIVIGATLLLGHWLRARGRRVVRPVCGARRTRPGHGSPPAEDQASRKPETAKATPAPNTAATTKSAPTRLLGRRHTTRQTIQAAKTPADSSRWVDGSRPERDRYDDDDEDDEDSSDGDRKLSKSDRKQLRKLKAQGRAA